MRTDEITRALSTLFAELTDGAAEAGGNFMLNAGDPGLLKSLDLLSADEASRNVHGGATIAAHAQHVRYGLSLMNEWGAHGGNPFADAKWDEAWKLSTVDDAAWREIRAGLRDECARWKDVLSTPREKHPMWVCGMISSIPHLAYHLGAMRQIAASMRGPKQGHFA
jgi:hypothetical protein